jgi:hypothetical protein
MKPVPCTSRFSRQANSFEELKTMIRDDVSCHFDDGQKPAVIRLHFVRDEVISAWGCLVT